MSKGTYILVLDLTTHVARTEHLLSFLESLNIFKIFYFVS